MASNAVVRNGMVFEITVEGKERLIGALADIVNGQVKVKKATQDAAKAAKTQVDAVKKQAGASSALKAEIASLAKSILPAVSAFIMLRKATQFLGDSYKAAEQQQLSMKKLDATLQATGRSATFTTQELSKMASGLQKVSNFGDEEIMDQAIASLLRYDSINKETFNRALQLTIDLAAETNDLSGAAKTLGLSLDDPILGMTRLRRAGVSFSAEQQNVIKGLVDSGKAAEAQAALMDALESKYGGLAKSQISYAKQLKNVWGDFQELIGAKLKPTMDGFYLGMQATLNAMINTSTQATATLEENTKKTIGGIARAVGSAVIVIKGIFELAANGIVAVIVSVEAVFRSWIAIATGLRNAVKLMNPFGSTSLSDLDPFAGLGDKLKDAWSKPGQIGSVFKDFGNTIQAQLDSLYRDIDTSLTNYYTKGKSGGGLEAGLDGVTGALTNQSAAIEKNGNAMKAWGNWAKWMASKIEEFAKFRMPATEIQGEVVSPDDLIASITNPQTVDAYQALIEENRALYDGINAVVNSMVNGFSTMLTSGRSFADSMKQIFKDMVSAILAEIAKMVAAMAVKALFNAMTGGGSSIVSVATSVAASAGVPASDTVMGEARYITPGSIPAIGGGVTLHSVVSELRQLRRDVYQAQPTAVQMDFKKGHLSYAVDRDRRYRDVMQTA